MPEIPIPVSENIVIPAQQEISIDRWGVPQVTIQENEFTGVITVNITSVKANENVYSPRTEDRVTMTIPNLIARFIDDAEAMQAIQAVIGGVLLISKKELEYRGIK